jgi:hypothetical protein
LRKPRLRFSSNVVRVLNLVTRRHEVDALVDGMPERFFLASFPLPEADAEIKVEPKRVVAYAVIDEGRSTVFILSARRIRVVIDSSDQHVMVPGRLVDKDTAQVLLFQP